LEAKPAAHLSPKAKRLWREMQEEYQIFDAQGLLLLNTLFECWDQMAEAQKLLRAEGYVTENPTTGHRRAHPAVAVLKEARLSYLRALQALNLDVEPAGPVGRPPGP